MSVSLPKNYVWRKTMSRIWYTSDLHIGHKLVAGLRDFYMDDLVVGDFIRHDEALADYWDATVAPDDTVFILGDTGIGRFDKYVLPWFRARRGIKHLVAGNHDPVHPSRSAAVSEQRKWLEVFASINPYLVRKIAGARVTLSHFPFASYGDGTTHGEPEGRWNEWRVPEDGRLLLHGHTHGPEKAHDKMLHVGWDAWGRFVSHDEVEQWVRLASQQP